MSFFYGAEPTNSSKPTNASSHDPFDTVILPGHKFKNGFATGTFIIVVATFVALIAIAIINRKTPVIPEPPEKIVNGKPEKKHITDATGGLCFWYMIYFIFDIIIRLCIEMQLEVPYAFVAMEVVSRFFLMVADLLLLFSVGWQLDEILRGRLNLKNDWLSYISRPFAMVGFVGIILVFFGERIAYIVMMVGYGFRWNQPDKTYYGITRTVYAGAYLLLAAMLWIRFIRYYMVYRRRVSSGSFNDRCGKIPLQLAAIIGPMITIRAATQFLFTFFYRLMKKRQNPNLEILRMGMLCIPLIVVLCTFIWMRRTDTDIKLRELAPVEFTPNPQQGYGGHPGQFEGDAMLPKPHQYQQQYHSQYHHQHQQQA